LPIQATRRIVACWADPVLVGAHSELDATVYAVVDGVTGGEAPDVATLLLRQRATGETRRCPETKLPDRWLRRSEQSGRQTAEVHVVTRLGAGGLELTEGRWDAQLALSGDELPTLSRRVDASRVDAMEADYGSTRPLGHPRYQARVTSLGRLVIDVHADLRHVEVKEVWVHESNIVVTGTTHHEGDTEPASSPMATARRRRDSAECHLVLSPTGAADVEVQVPLAQLAARDHDSADEDTWDLLLTDGGGQLRFAGILDDIQSKKAVFMFPSVRVGDRLVRPHYDAQNYLVVSTTPVVA
jgi:hypothetical protein